jgi:pimeloyl-ACP methyl ester carboxylesterase
MSAFKDVVILLPGISGSALCNSEGKEVWSPSAGAIWRAITSFGDSLKDLELAPTGDPDGVTAPRLVSDVTIVPGLIKIDGYSRIEKYLVLQLALEPGKNYFSFPYDWRLDNRVNGKRLAEQAMIWLTDWRNRRGPVDAKLILIGHSMGGLVARYFLECEGGWKHARALITVGTPHRGSFNALDFLVHGMKKGIGPFGLDLSRSMRSYPSVYQLLPTYPCIDCGSAELSRIAAAAVAGRLPFVDAERAADARKFHQEIEDAQTANSDDATYRESGYRLVPIVGIEQPTYQSARSDGSVVKLLRSYESKDEGGDGTVPRVSATPWELSDAAREVFAAEMHGSLQNGDGTLANLKGVITQPIIDLRKYREEIPTQLALDLDDVVPVGEALTVRARALHGDPAIAVTMTNVDGGQRFDEVLTRSTDPAWKNGQYRLPAGTWRVRISADGATPVTDLAVVANA